MSSGEWSHRAFKTPTPDLSLDQDFSSLSVDLSSLSRLRKDYLRLAAQAASELPDVPESGYKRDSSEIEALKYFDYLE
jgi:hypothetical protein